MHPFLSWHATRRPPIQLPVGWPSLVSITPSDEDERQAVAMETWLQACASDEPFALELVGNNRQQQFLLRARSAAQLTLLCKQLSAQYPQADLLPLVAADDPLRLQAGEQAVVGEFALAQPAWLPLKTFGGKTLLEPGADPLAAILAAMESVSEGCRVICQLALVRAPQDWMGADLRKAVEHPLQAERDASFAGTHRGRDASGNEQGVRLLIIILLALSALLVSRWYTMHRLLPLFLLAAALLIGAVFLLGRRLRSRPTVLYEMKQVAEKLARQGFYTRLRVIVIGPEQHVSQTSLRTLVTSLEVAYRQFSAPSANSLLLKRLRTVRASSKRALRLPDPLCAFPFWHPLARLLHGGAFSADIWNSLELAGAYHLPQAGTDLPLVRRISVKHLLFPPQLAATIAQASAPLPPVKIGESGQRGHTVPVLLPAFTLFGHKLLIGRSRSGKSVLMQLLLAALLHPTQDGSPQPGVFVMDPHRDLVEDVLSQIPASWLPRVLLFDLADTCYPIAINPLDASMGFTRDQAVANLMSSFERIWKETWGPRMAYFLKNVCLLLYTLNERLVREGRANEQFTLLDINPLLQYQDYAIAVLSTLDLSETWQRELLAWWQHTYFTLPKNSSFRQEVILPILSKMGVFTDNQQLRRIVGQPVTKAPLHQAVTEGKIVLCALSSRDMDDGAVNILGSTLINLLHRAFAAQSHIPFPERRKVFVAIDEFQAFSGADYDKLLSEDAKYGCAMTMATQNLKRLNQIKEGLLEMALANCENLFVFTVSAADAKLLEAELQEKVTPRHIMSQPRLHCYARLAMAGSPPTIASLTLAHPPGWERRAAPVPLASLRHDLHNRLALFSADEVDRLHATHLARFLDIGPAARKIQRDARANQNNQPGRQLAAAQQEILQAQLTTGSMLALRQASATPSPADAPADPTGVSASMQARGPKNVPVGSIEVQQAVPSSSIQPAHHPAEEADAPTPQSVPEGEKQPERVGQKKPRRRRHRRVGLPPPEPGVIDPPSAEVRRPILFVTGANRSAGAGAERERERERA